MEFVATKPGFFKGSLHEQGARFEAPDDFKASWAVPVNAPEAKAAKPTKAARQAPKALSEMAKPGMSFNDVVQGDLA